MSIFLNKAAERVVKEVDLTHLVPKPIVLIGLTGRRHVGKTTFANYLVKSYGFTRVHPFDGGKAMCKTYYMRLGAPEDIAERMINGDLKDVPSPYLSNNATSRFFMERLGKFIGYDIGEEWTLGAEVDRAVCYGATRLIVESLVYENATIRKYNGTILRLKRESANTVGEVSDEYQNKIVADLVLYNNGSIEHFYASIDSLFEDDGYLKLRFGL